MKYHAVRAASLSPADRALWGRLQEQDPHLDTPYFRPEFLALVAEARPGCEVAVMEDGGRAVGFLPFFRGRGGIALPCADSLTDFQGALVEPGVAWNLDDLLHGCGLKALHWDHIVPGAAQAAFEPYRCATADSPFMDVSGGYEQYKARRLKPKSNDFTQAERKLRKAEREVGPVRLEPFSADPAHLETLIEWKVAQYLRTRTRNVFNQRWVLDLLARARQADGPHLRGALSALFIGDELAALHFGMLSGGVLHSWFPVYRVDLAAWSPGLMLLIELARAAPELGVRRIDLGKGPEGYKVNFMTAATPLAEAHVDRRPLWRPLRQAWLRTRERIVSSRFEKPARAVWFGTRRLLGLRKI
jgi:CelD/BcsL family acetyltransferase involved in cellulose biosynthesis